MTQSTLAPILLVDDHAMFRAGLTMVIRSRFADLQLLEAGSMEAGLRTPSETLTLVLLDIHLPGLNGIDAIPVFQRKWPATPIVMLSSTSDTQSMEQAALRGAAGYLSKEASATEIIRLIERVINKEALGPAGHVKGTRADHGGRPHLTPRQSEVLDLLCQGLPNKLIGRRLGVSENTVRGHVQAILALLEVDSRTEAVVKARRTGLAS
ncbi:MAG TPA: response regulator transcription factor [Steroidobacteraceae bacterium]|nr:response regulator transcription factor [Steroidobacteraceae bacterium]